MTPRREPSEDWEDDEYELDNDDQGDDSSEQLPCPACGASVYEEAEQCPHCGDWINPRRSAARHRPWVWITAVILLGIFAWLAIHGL